MNNITDRAGIAVLRGPQIVLARPLTVKAVRAARVDFGYSLSR